MRALPVVARQVSRDALAYVARAGIIIQIDLLVCDGAPEPLGKNVIEGTAFPIHTDANPRCFPTLRILRTGDVAALITLPDARRGDGQGGIDGIAHEWQFPRVIERPAHDIARVPIPHSNQIHPALAHADRGDVNAPDVIRLRGRDAT